MLLGALGVWLGFPNDVWHFPPLVLLYPFALVFLGEYAHKNGQGYMEALRKGWLTGILGTSGALYWLAIPIHNVGGLPWALAFPCALAVGAYVALYGGLFSLAAYRLYAFMPHNPLRRMLALACLWYGLELARGAVFTGFPWLSLSVAFAPYPLLIQGASLMGSYALSGWYVALALFCLSALQKEYSVKKRLVLGLSAASICLATFLWGHTQLTKADLAEKTPPFPVILVEGNIDQNVKWEPKLQQATLDTYMQLSTEALHTLRIKQPQAQPLLIWPETAMPFFIEQHPVLGHALISFINQAHTPLLVGAPAINIDDTGRNRPFNRAYFINERGELINYYDKVHLVPFGEYVPPWLKWNFLEGLLQNIGAFSVGQQREPLKNVHNAPPIALALGVLICYESIFPELAQEHVQRGANVLVNISNDGWFGDSSAPQQHLQLALMRAVEQGRWLIRNTNTGISAIVDAQGRIRLRGTQFVAQSLTGQAHTSDVKTIFHLFYRYIPYGIVGIFFLCIGTAYLTKRRTSTS